MTYPSKVVTIGRNIKRNVLKLPFLQRGRRVRNGKCRICGEYYPKQIEYLRKQNPSTKKYYISKTIFYITCRNHGRTNIEKKDGKWLITEYGIEYEWQEDTE